MRLRTRIAPPYSLLYVADPNGGEPPEPDEAPIWSTRSCIAIRCFTFSDGETDVSLGAADEVDPGSPPAFDATLLTPSREVVVSTAEYETILRMDVRNTKARVRVWVNHPTEPDVVIIGLG